MYIKILMYIYVYKYKKVQYVKIIRILWILNILMYIYVYKCKKSSICQNNKNFTNIKYINIYIYINVKKV